MKLGGVPLAELRSRYASENGDVSPAVLRALRADRRAGARQLADQHTARRARRGVERRRLTRLFRHERELHEAGHTFVAGVDEVGMGPLAGPVVAAAVVLRPGAELFGLRDSKQLSEAARIRLDAEIRGSAFAVSIGLAEPEEIDRVNIYQAGLLAMRRAVEGLHLTAGFLLVDARRIPAVATPQRGLVRGDQCVGSICAASIVAKVWRDARMAELEKRFPGYGFARNAGYGTAEHLSALAQRGPTQVHRRSFAPVRRCFAPPSQGFAPPDQGVAPPGQTERG